MSLTVVASGAWGRQVIDTLGPVSSLQFTSALPGGDTACQFTLGIPADANPIGLTFGTRLTVMDGPIPVWAGLLADAQRGVPWQIAATGLSAYADHYVALDGSGNASTDAQTAVNAAIARGLPWTNLGTLTTPSGVTFQGSMLGDLLDAVATANGQYWQVDQNGQVSMAPAPTVPSWLMVASNTLGDRTIDQYATDEYVRYTTQAFGSNGMLVQGPPSVVAAPNNPASTAPRPYGRWERLDDITSAGPLTAAAAQTYGNGQLALQQPRATFSGTLTVQPGDLRTLGGQPVRLTTVRAGQMIRILGVQPDPATAELVFSLSVQIVLGTWTYNADTNTAQCSALGAPARPTLAVPTSPPTATGGSYVTAYGGTGVPPHNAPLPTR